MSNDVSDTGLARSAKQFQAFDFEGVWSRVIVRARSTTRGFGSTILVPSSRGRRTTTGDALIVALPRYNVSRMFL